MKTYKDFRPTAFDSHLSLDGREHWLVLPTSRTRDSGCLEESNFHCALSMLGGESETVEVHRFGHWGPGWFELIIVQPGSAAEATAHEICDRLDGYPVLDEDDLSERETLAADEVWRVSYRVEDRLDYIRKHRSQFHFSDMADMLGCVRGKYFAGYASELLA